MSTAIATRPNILDDISLLLPAPSRLSRRATSTVVGRDGRRLRRAGPHTLALGLDAGQPADDIEKSHVQLLQLAFELERAETAGGDLGELLRALSVQKAFPPKYLEAAWRTIPKPDKSEDQSIAIGELRVGMILADDVNTQSGVLVAPRGCEVTASLLDHLRQFVGDIDGGAVKIFDTESATVQ